MTKKLLLAFFAGAFGGFLNDLFFWLYGVAGVTTLLGMNAPVKWDPAHNLLWDRGGYVWQYLRTGL